jgi:hypothetical protein
MKKAFAWFHSISEERIKFQITHGSLYPLNFAFSTYTPFLISPRGEMLFTPSPLGEGWEGGNVKTFMTYCTSVNLRLKPKLVFEVGKVLATKGLFIVRSAKI